MTEAESRDKPLSANILVVDDRLDSLEALLPILQECGYRPRPVTSGQEGIETARRDLPDLILLDIKMPGKDGFQICEELKANARLSEVPVIFLTAVTDTAEKIRAFEAGGVDYITKPFEAAEVKARVRTHVQLRRLLREKESLQKRLLATLDRVSEKTRELAEVIELLQRLGDEVSSQRRRSAKAKSSKARTTK